MTTGLLIEQVAAAEAAGRAKAAEAYRALLLRADKPRAGDVEKLAECLRALGKQPADAAADVATLAKAAELEAAGAGFIEADGARVKADQDYAAYHAETVEIAASRAAGLAALGQVTVLAGERMRRVRAARDDLAALRQAHAGLFGLAELPPAERPPGTPGMAAVGSGMPRAAGGPS